MHLFTLISFPLHVTIFTAESPHTISIITINTQFVLLVVVGYDGCYQIFYIKSNGLHGDPLWKISYFIIEKYPQEPFPLDVQSL